MVTLHILTYQKIGTPPKNTPLSREWTSLKRFTRTLDKIKKRGIPVVSPAEIVEGKVTTDSVLLLFLDAYRSFYTEVYPLLRTRDWAACVCLPTACINGHNRWQDPHRESWQDLLSWEEIKILSKDAHISFGAQALNREDLSLLSPEQARYAVQESLFRLSKNLSHPPQLFAFSPMQKPLKNSTEILPDFNGLMVFSDKAVLKNSPLRFKVVRGNSWRSL